jgi:hypothetical protein
MLSFTLKMDDAMRQTDSLLIKKIWGFWKDCSNLGDNYGKVETEEMRQYVSSDQILESTGWRSVR